MTEEQQIHAMENERVQLEIERDQLRREVQRLQEAADYQESVESQLRLALQEAQKVNDSLTAHIADHLMPQIQEAQQVAKESQHEAEVTLEALDKLSIAISGKKETPVSELVQTLQESQQRVMELEAVVVTFSSDISILDTLKDGREEIARQNLKDLIASRKKHDQQQTALQELAEALRQVKEDPYGSSHWFAKIEAALAKAAPLLPKEGE